jgi:hypothetical protein
MAYLVLLSGERSGTALSPSASNLGPAGLLAGVGVILKNGLKDWEGKSATSKANRCRGNDVYRVNDSKENKLNRRGFHCPIPFL